MPDSPSLQQVRIGPRNADGNADLLVGEADHLVLRYIESLVFIGLPGVRCLLVVPCDQNIWKHHHNFYA